LRQAIPDRTGLHHTDFIMAARVDEVARRFLNEAA
jgi:hypothetical protein